MLLLCASLGLRRQVLTLFCVVSSVVCEQLKKYDGAIKDRESAVNESRETDRKLMLAQDGFQVRPPTPLTLPLPAFWLVAHTCFCPVATNSCKPSVCSLSCSNKAQCF